MLFAARHEFREFLVELKNVRTNKVAEFTFNLCKRSMRAGKREVVTVVQMVNHVSLVVIDTMLVCDLVGDAIERSNGLFERNPLSVERETEKCELQFHAKRGVIIAKRTQIRCNSLRTGVAAQ